MKKIQAQHYAFAALDAVEDDGLVRFNSQIMLFSEKTKSFVAVSMCKKL